MAISIAVPGAEPPAPTAPDVTLIALANDGKLSQLLPEYLKLQWLRLKGAAPNEALANGDLPASMAANQWNYLIANFSDFPDFTYFMLRPFSKMFKTPAEKHVFYDATTKVFEKLKRADLVAKVQEDEKNEQK